MLMPRKKKQKKIFVLDTSVILYNHNAIYSFEDNDVAIPITVLEELDHFKKGNETKNFETREFIRIMDKLSANNSLQNWIPIDRPKHGHFKVIMKANPTELDATGVFGDNTADHRILNAALAMTEEHPEKKVILVTKDINLRLKAKSLNILAADFETGKIKDVESLYTGHTVIEGLDREVIDNLYANNFCMTEDVGIKDPIPNHYFILKNNKTSALVFYNPVLDRIERLEKHPAYRITPRNAEQVFALHAISNPKVKLVTLQGVAGTGKTLLAWPVLWIRRRISNRSILPGPLCL
jgi:PhoH-like ATPase